MKTFAVLLASIATFVLAGTAGTTARAGTITPLDEGGVCYNASYDCGNSYGDSGASSQWYDAARGGPCKTVWGRRVRKNLYGVTVYTYYEQVTFCWRNGVVSYFWRDRWTGGTSLSWSFDGNTYTNCGPVDPEHCSGKVNAATEVATTQGHFHVCLGFIGINFCKNKYPAVTIQVWAGGGVAVSTSG